MTIPCSVDVLLTTDEGIREINQEQRNIDQATDVLSFPMLELTPGTPPDGTGEDEQDPETGLCPLGDMVISVDRAKAQAAEFGHSVERELAYLAVHSVLHLLGYDHLDEGPQKAQMRAREEAILEGIGVTRDHFDESLNAPLAPAASTQPEVKRCGMITLCGRPNVGKSTLTNALVGEKVAIVSNKPQTTRNRICGVLTRGECQFVFLDTPGLHRAANRLGDYMVDVVRRSVADVDAVLLLVEPIPNVGGPEKELIEQIKKMHVPSVLVINKIDTVEKPQLLAVMEAYSKVHDFPAILPISARRKEGLDELLDLAATFLPEGPQLFPRDAVTDQPERQICGEIVREKLLYCLDKEVPHGTAVEVTKFSERESGIIDLHVTIYCEKASHKGIIIGKQGSMLKIVLREINYKEADKILTVLTREEGKLTIKARGCRRKNSRLLASSQLLVYSELAITQRGEFITLAEGDPLTQFRRLGEDIDKLALASYFAEVTEKTVQEGEVCPDILSRLLNCLYALDTLDKPLEQVKAVFQLRLLTLTGLAPLLDTCVVCGNPQPAEPRLHLLQGVLHCAACRTQVGDGVSMPLSPAALAAARYIVAGEAKKLFSFSLTPEACKQLDQVTEAFLMTQQERGFRTLDYYKQLRRQSFS